MMHVQTSEAQNLRKAAVTFSADRLICLLLAGSNGLGTHGAAAEAEGLLPDS